MSPASLLLRLHGGRDQRALLQAKPAPEREGEAHRERGFTQVDREMNIINISIIYYLQMDRIVDIYWIERYIDKG